MAAAIFVLTATTLLLTACSNNNEFSRQATTVHAPARILMADLAATQCVNAGGTLALSRQLDGSSVEMCQLANGRRCGESPLMNGSCTPWFISRIPVLTERRPVIGGYP